MMQDPDGIDRVAMKSWALAIVDQVDPQDSFVVEDNFEALGQDWKRADAQDEGHFFGGAEVAAFAALVVPFLVGLLGDVFKDVVKDQAKRATSRLLDKLLKREASVSEAARLRQEIEAEIDRRTFSQGDKATLREGFAKLFSKLEPVQ